MSLDPSRITRPKIYTVIPAKLGNFCQEMIDDIEQLKTIPASRDRIFFLASLLQNTYELGRQDGKEKCLENLRKIMFKEFE